MSNARTRAGLLAAALVVNLLLVGGPGASKAHACTCALVSTERQIKTSDAVFSGEVVSIEPGERAANVSPPSLGLVTFEVEDSWKGALEGAVDVYGHGPGASCGIKFDEGKSYLVYARRSGGGDTLQTGLCDSTKPLEQAEDDLRLLGSPGGSLPGTGGYGVTSPEDAAMLVAVPALLVLAGALILRRGMSRLS
jgi:hypothetical protein